MMKKLISVLLSTATVFSLALLPVSATSIPEVESAAILEQPQLTNEDAHVLTMEMFNEAFTRDDVINILAADKANGMASTYAYVPVTVTEAEIQEFYAKIEAIVARAPALSYYFSNYYWWTRDDDDYYLYDEENQIIGIAKGEELDDISQEERERIRAIKEDRSK